MEQKQRKKWFIGVGGVLLLLAGMTYPIWGTFSGNSEQMVYIYPDDNVDSLYHKIGQKGSLLGTWSVRMLSQISGFASHIRPGRYDVGSGASPLRVFRNFRNGHQTPVLLTVPTLRTIEDLSQFLGKNFSSSAQEFEELLTNEAVLKTFGKTKETAITLFLPNTYEVYWTTTPKELLKRMKDEEQRFWTDLRLAKAKSLNLTPEEVMTVASIVNQETAYLPEKSRVAGMYLNRLNKQMPLQADPTVKFALKDFGLRRILHTHLAVDSPYNTYKHVGLPPGPICISELSSIDAVLNVEHNDYLYMCAKEDFSGSHNFAKTYEEHLRNAAKYTKALDERGIN